jgi:6,7-dimethyl-8-ribityllumazine synthase
MSKLSSPRPRAPKGSQHFSIVASQFNADYVQGLIDHALAELRALNPKAKIDILRVPGAFEIPIVVRELASNKNGDAIIAIGVILKGETDHAKNLSHSVTAALQQVAVEHRVPVINAVLSFDDEAQARARCLENKINRGTEAARAAIEIANTMSTLRRRSGQALRKKK